MRQREEHRASCRGPSVCSPMTASQPHPFLFTLPPVPPSCPCPILCADESNFRCGCPILHAVVFVVAFDDHLKLHKGGAATKQSRTLEMALKPAGPPVPRVVQPASEVETVDFKLPKNAKAGQILHVLVPGQHDLQVC